MTALDNKALLYASETQRFYSIFCPFGKNLHEEVVGAAMSLLHKGNTRLHPAEIAREMLAGRTDITEAVKAACDVILAKAFTDDPNTGLLIGAVNPVVVGTAHLLAARADVPAIIDLEDLSNLTGCNHCIGRDNADKLTRQMCDTAKRILSEELGEHVSISGIKSGGDEYTTVAMVTDTEKFLARFPPQGDEDPSLSRSQLAARILQAQYQEIKQREVLPAINILVAELELNDVRHNKQGKPPGVSTGSGSVVLNGETNPADLLAEAERRLAICKLEDAALRYGLVNQEGIDDYLREIMEPYLRETLKSQFEPVEIRFASDMGTLNDIISNKNAWEKAVYDTIDVIEQDLQLLARDTRERWDALVQPGGAFYEHYKASGSNTPRDFFVSLAENASLKREMLAALPRRAIDDEPPFHDQTIIHVDEIAASERLRKALAASGLAIADSPEPLIRHDDNVTPKRIHFNGDLLQGMPDAERNAVLMIVRTMAFMEGQNPVSRTPGNRFAVVDAERQMDREGTRKARIIKTEIGNLSGFNAVNPSFANAVYRKFGDIMKEEIAALGEPLRDRINLHDVGNGRIVMAVTDRFPEDVLETLQETMENRIKAEIFARNIFEFALETYANPGSHSETSGVLMDNLRHDVDVLQQKYHLEIATLADIPNPRDPDKRARVNKETVEIGRDMDGFSKRDSIMYAVGEKPLQVTAALAKPAPRPVHER